MISRLHHFGVFGHALHLRRYMEDTSRRHCYPFSRGDINKLYLAWPRTIRLDFAF
jgi:hypothetical protein